MSITHFRKENNRWTHCGRSPEGVSSSSNDWAQVTCKSCLRVRPRSTNENGLERMARKERALKNSEKPPEYMR